MAPLNADAQVSLRTQKAGLKSDQMVCYQTSSVFYNDVTLPPTDPNEVCLLRAGQYGILTSSKNTTVSRYIAHK